MIKFRQVSPQTVALVMGIVFSAAALGLGYIEGHIGYGGLVALLILTIIYHAQHMLTDITVQTPVHIAPKESLSEESRQQIVEHILEAARAQQTRRRVR